MAELAPDDLPAAVRARFEDDAAAQAAIDSALAAARRYCGWHVSPVRTNEVLAEIDGPGGRVLSLPTLNLISVASITELGAALDVTKLDRSRRKGTLTKHFGWWTCRDGAITATITHGLTEAEAADWRAAIVAVVDERSDPNALREDGDMKVKKVDDVQYEWFSTLVSVDQELAGKLSQFRILPAP